MLFRIVIVTSMSFMRNDRTKHQVDFFSDFNERQKSIEEGRDFQSILERVGELKFGRSDLYSYNRQLSDLTDRVKSAHSTLKTYIQTLGQFKTEKTKQAVTEEAVVMIRSDLIEFMYICQEMLIGKHGEGSLIPKDERKRKK